MRRTILTILVGLMLLNAVDAQYSPDLRINEVQAINENGIHDQYGDAVAWIEVFNTAYNAINMSGLYLSNDPNDLTKYKLPADVNLKIPQRSYFLFYCDGNSAKSNFHTNFILDSTGVVYLTDGDGKTIIDSVVYAFEKPDVSYMRKIDGEPEWVYLETATPLQANTPAEKSKSADTFIEYDPTGVGMALIAMFVVMSALVLSYLTFKYVSRLYRSDLKKKKEDEVASTAETEEGGLSGEVAAAIAMSLNLYIHQMHDLEDTIITIRKISKTYSPWSSKLYMLRPWPHKRNR